jgi:hypothetical protein
MIPLRINQTHTFSISSQVTAVFENGKTFGEKVLKHVDHISVDEKDDSLFHFESDVLLFLAHGVRIYGAIELLWKHGFASEAFALARILFELLLQAQYLLQDSKLRWPRFDAYCNVVLVREYSEEADPNRKARLLEALGGEKRLAQLSRLNRQFPKEGMGWWGHSIGWLARAVGRYDTYKTLYKHQSDHIHYTPRGFWLKLLRITDAGDFELLCCPVGPPDYSRAPVSLTPFSATMDFHDLLRCVSKALALDITAESDAALRELAEVLAGWVEHNRRDYITY